MPFISLSTTKSLSDTQKDNIKSGIGEAIYLLPNKNEKVLMVDISDNHSMFFGGEKKESCAYVDVKIYGFAGFKAKKEFTEAVFNVLDETAGLKNNEVFLTISQFDNWGTGGSMK